jgi:hypothetical protein
LSWKPNEAMTRVVTSLFCSIAVDGFETGTVGYDPLSEARRGSRRHKRHDVN